MDSYDEVHEVKNGQSINTPPESLNEIEKQIESSANTIKFDRNVEGGQEEKFQAMEVRKFY